MTIFLSDSYNILEDTINHLKSINLNRFPGVNITDFYAAILVDYERLDSDGAFNIEQLGYITRIFKGCYDYSFHI